MRTSRLVYPPIDHLVDTYIPIRLSIPMSKENQKDNTESSKMEELIRRAESLAIEDYLPKSATTNVYNEVVELVKAKTELEKSRGKDFWYFTPTMLAEIFSDSENTSKYYADLLWTHSDNPKNVKANPKNEVLFHSPQRGLYHLITEDQ